MAGCFIELLFCLLLLLLHFKLPHSKKVARPPSPQGIYDDWRQFFFLAFIFQNLTWQDRSFLRQSPDLKLGTKSRELCIWLVFLGGHWGINFHFPLSSHHPHLILTSNPSTKYLLLAVSDSSLPVSPKHALSCESPGVLCRMRIPPGLSLELMIH